MFHHAVAIGKERGWVTDGEPVIYVYGPPAQPVLRVLVASDINYKTVF